MTTDLELNKQHDRNCRIIVAAIGCLDLETAVEWSKVQLSKTDDLSYYMKQLHLKRKQEKEGEKK
jgi:hypothetical protein